MDNVGYVACASASTPEVDQQGGDDCDDNGQKGHQADCTHDNDTAVA